MKRLVLIFCTSLIILTSCEESSFEENSYEDNTITIINNSNHEIRFAIGNKTEKTISDLDLRLNTDTSYTQYFNTPGTIYLHYGSVEFRDVQAEYMGEITLNNYLTYMIDTIFEDICGTCSLFTEQDGEITETTSSYPYCNSAFLDKQSSTPTTIGGVTTYWECTEN